MGPKHRVRWPGRRRAAGWVVVSTALSLPTQAEELRADGKMERTQRRDMVGGLESREEALAAIPLVSTLEHASLHYSRSPNNGLPVGGGGLPSPPFFASLPSSVKEPSLGSWCHIHTSVLPLQPYSICVFHQAIGN